MSELPEVELDLEEDSESADWPKQTWDLWDTDGLIDSVPRLREWLRWQNITVAHFKSLPVYRFNKEQLPWLSDL